MTEKEKEMMELLKKANRLLKADSYKLFEKEEVSYSIDNFFWRLELEGIKEKFDCIYRADKNCVLIRSIKKRDKIEFVKDYGFYDFIKPIIEKYWDNMDELFDKLEEIYLTTRNIRNDEEGEENNE